MRRLSRLERDALQLLRQHSHLSYEAMAEHLNCDRSSAMIVVKRLERRRRIVKIAGKGHTPNRYLLTDRVLQW